MKPRYVPILDRQAPLAFSLVLPVNSRNTQMLHAFLDK